MGRSVASEQWCPYDVANDAFRWIRPVFPHRDEEVLQGLNVSLCLLQFSFGSCQFACKVRLTGERLDGVLQMDDGVIQAADFGLD